MTDQHIHVHVHMHPEADETTKTALADLSHHVTTLLRQGAAMTEQMDRIQTILTTVDTATNEIANDLQALRDRINQAGGTLSPEETTLLTSQLDSLAARLELMGRDPENPAPNPNPVPTDPAAGSTPGGSPFPG